IVYGFVLLPVMYMIFGLSQTLPDTVLRWIGAGISSMGETQATEQMRANSEKFGPSALQGGTSPRGKDDAGNSNRLSGDHGGAGRSGGGNYPRLLSANGQGVAPQQHDAAPTTSASSGSAAPSGSTRSTAAASASAGSSLNTGSQGVTGSRWGNSEDITDAEFIEVKDTPRSSAARPASTGETAEKASNAVLALGSAGVISSVSADTADSDVGGNAPALHYDTRYIPPTASTAEDR